ncbi:hypothetical protein ANO14919_113600 [Xylariales sp. No.14919]|nr:hypothetical protein ANO14919_113600 [Xylariales sp. No.14919]
MEESNRIAELEERLRAAENRAREAERGRQAEQERAVRAERRQQAEQERADKAEAQLRPTTLDEYIEACHDLIYINLNVEPDPEKRTTGSIPPPYAKYFPRHLRPWTDFHDEQREILSKVYRHFPIKRRLFHNRNYLETLGNKAMDAPLANEKMLETFLHNCVEDPVRCIIHELGRSRDFQKRLKIGHGIAFENHLKALSDPSYEVANRWPQQPRPRPPPPQGPEQVEERPKTPDPAKDPPRLNPDQICVYRYEEEGTEKRSVIAISEYKPPHKLSLPQLRAGLREIDMMEIVTNNKIPEDEEAKFRHYATELVASAVTQAFHYMIKSGLAYGLLTTGEGIVFLKIDWNEPQVVYYHLAEPAEEVAAHKNYRSCSAVSQYLGFHLLALSDYSHRGQDVRDRAMSGLHTWTTDFRKAASTVPEGQRIPPRSSPSFIPSAYLSVDRTVPRRSRRLRRDSDHVSDPAMRWSDEDGGDGEGGRSPNRRNSPSPTEGQASRRSARLAGRHADSGGSRGAGGGGRTTGREGQGSDRSEFEGKPHRDLAYCTQKCLLGLVKGDVLDPECPNLKLHQHRNSHGSVVNINSRHSIGHDEFLQLLSHQLKCTLDYGITSLDITGARGALFKVTLLGYGYTFISKGTVRAFIPDLEHEARVYERLKDIQGVHVPVFLGAVNLRSLNRTYYYDFRIDIVHLCLMSWGGLSLRDGQDPGRNMSTLQPMAMEAMRAIHQRGVVHKDARYENILFNPQTGGVMLIDFERSQLLDKPRPTLAALEPNKRRRVQDAKGQARSVGSSANFSADLAGVKAAFQTLGEVP